MTYERIGVENIFNAPVFYAAETESTMNDARILASRDYPNGTVICAGAQTAGRGRIDGRRWESARDKNLLCTILFRGAAPPYFTLRCGLAAARTFETFIGRDRIKIKWPNDVFYMNKKLSGILCESDGECIYAGIGMNVAQKEFPENIAAKTTSLALIIESPPSPRDVLAVLLRQMSEILDGKKNAIDEINKRLLYIGEEKTFLCGRPEDGRYVNGVVAGVNEDGALLITGKDNKQTPYVSGEIIV